MKKMGANWKFHLYADQLNAADLDRWGRAESAAKLVAAAFTPAAWRVGAEHPASELVRRVNAEGELGIAQLTIEKLKLEQVLAKGSLHDLPARCARSAGRMGGAAKCEQRSMRSSCLGPSMRSPRNWNA